MSAIHVICGKIGRHFPNASAVSQVTLDYGFFLHYSPTHLNNLKKIGGILA
jgi:hypothetical protein